MRQSSSRGRIWFAAVLSMAVVACILFCTLECRAESTIRTPGDRARYSFEAEPHLLFGPFSPPGFAGGDGFGFGFRGSIEIVPDGFIRKINDSVAIGFGADWLRYEGRDPRGRCVRFESGPAGVPICVEVEGSGGSDAHVFLPVVMQWNFWLARQWSVFGEPGAAFHWHDSGGIGFQPFVLYLGGRFHVSEAVTLVLRVGHPTFSLGVSFLL